MSGDMKKFICQLRRAFLVVLLAAQVTSAFAAGPLPHIDNRGFHGRIDLTIADHLLVRCSGIRLGQLYLGHSQVRDVHFLQTGIVPGGHYGRHDRARMEKCLGEDRQ